MSLADEMLTHHVELHGRAVGFRQVGSGPVVVLVHGLAGTMRTWDGVVPELADRYTVVAPDLPGHGDSARPAGDYSLGAYASALRDLLDALGHASATMVGHSFGGGVALQFAYQFPERCDRLVLVSSGGLGTEVNLALRAATLPGSEFVIPLLAHRQVVAAGNTLGTWARAVRVPGATTLLQTWQTFAALSEAEPRRTFLHTVRAVIDHRGQRVSAADRLYLAQEMPTLIVWGTNDRIIPVKHAHSAHEAMPGGQLELFDGAGHFPHISHPDRFVQALRTFIDSTQAAPAERRGSTGRTSRKSDPGRSPGRLPARPKERSSMTIIRNEDGTLVVPVEPGRSHGAGEDEGTVSVDPEGEVAQAETAPTTRTLHPGEGGYDEALAEWDLEQNPDREPVVSTATGRQEAMTLVHAVATSPDHAVGPAVEALDDPEAGGEALRHVLVGGVHSVEAFAEEVAEAEGGDPLPPHQVTKIIGEVLSELDS